MANLHSKLVIALSFMFKPIVRLAIAKFNCILKKSLCNDIQQGLLTEVSLLLLAFSSSRSSMATRTTGV